ncbi:MAG TPA: type I restriction enzyme HsdR N-terminal domain-containing protein [Bacteroidetes bacterium]|nr:type I restriction enzyme HsdR N-terminal domain-containing protein [Bacteroidota bacterium]
MRKSLPIFELKTKKEAEKTYVWGALRKRYLLFSPEEHVRQCLIQYLLQHIHVPKALISIERGLTYNNRQKRYDLLVFDREGQALLACECKAPQIEIDDKAAFQLAVYNQKIGAPYLLLTNGPILLSYQQTQKGPFAPLLELPTFEEMINSHNHQTNN